ncbi:ras guanine nucleotide exchange factor domain-containing protein [Syncephalastrum racemosum]|uniref:Ras guanine nucleotide exchange factor domain-containing protein n=1 Tax=Syncephalastrum racemosum TaxID=13706 RepID=A0A1X2HS26_SYNRA|nr:ras guanine nucleotide exchange factor domain-containing protein [Syncephalastrum racemosum]
MTLRSPLVNTTTTTTTTTVASSSPTSPPPTDPSPLSPPSSLPSSPRNTSPPEPSTLTSHFVQALHNYLPTNAPADQAVSCLFFRKGAIIEVLNRDDSGWWDGSSGGVRGWFPSNYVGRIGEAVRHSADFDDEQSQQEYEAWRQHASSREDIETPSMQSRVELARALLNEDRERSRSGPVDDDDAALRKNEGPSPFIPAWDTLMEEVSRRMSELVDACALPASSNIQLVIFQVVSSIRAVLTAANTVSNDSPLLRANPELARQRKVILSTLSKLVLKGKELQAVPESDEPLDEQVPALANQLLSEMDGFEDILRRIPLEDTDSMSSEDDSSNNHHNNDDDQQEDSVSPRSSLVSVESTSTSSLRQQLVDARLSSVSLIAKAVPLSDAQHILQTLLEHQATIDELMTGLLTTIEKYMANRQRATEMLEMTRKGVEAIRTFLAVVEHVCSNVGDLDYKHYSVIPEDPHLVALVLAKESVYSAITALVTGVRALAGPRGQYAQQDFDHIRQSCENVVRTTNESAARVRACLQVESPTTDENVNDMRERLENSVDTRRNQTLSILGRKATALNVLQHQYDARSPSTQQQQQQQQNLSLATDENDVENLAIPTKESAHYTAPAIPTTSQSTQMPRRPRASSKASLTGRSSNGNKLSRTDNVRRSNASNTLPARVSSASSNRTSSASNMLRQSLESMNNTPLTTPETMSPVLETERQHHQQQLPPLPNQMNAYYAPPPAPKHQQQQHPPELKLLSSKSTPTIDQRPRRPRELSVSGFRMSLKQRHHDTPQPSQDPRLRRTSSWLSMNERRDSVMQPPQAEKMTPSPTNDPWFLKQRAFSEDEMMYNAEGQVTGATIEALVEKLTQHEKSPELLFTRAFFYNFRLFTTPTTFVQLLINRFSICPPEQLSQEDMLAWTNRVLLPVRLRVYNVTKTWLEMYFSYEHDACTESMLVDFATGAMSQAMPGPAKRMLDLIRIKFTSRGSVVTGRKMSFTNNSHHDPQLLQQQIQQQITPQRPLLHKAASSSHLSLASGSSLFSSTLTLFEDHSDASSSSAVPPTPSIARSLRNTLRKTMSQGSMLTGLPVSDFEPVEIARQLTLMESSLFCQIQPNEMIGQEFKKKVGQSSAVHVKAMIQRSTQITSWVTDTILRESEFKKRAQMIKFWIKVGDCCLQLSNYNTLMAIRSALASTSVARLKRTWEFVSAKYKNMYEPIYKATDSDRNFAEYRRRLKNAVAPCLPFLGVYLTDMTFIDDGNSKQRTSPGGQQLINFDKYIKITRILNEIDQFQIAYKLQEVDEIQRYLLQCLETGEKDDQVFYTRSLHLEPREEELDIKSFIANLA